MSTHHGNDGLILSSAGEVGADRAGLWTGSCIYKLPAGRLDLLPAVGTVHPYATFLNAERFRLAFNPGLWVLSVDYAGMVLTYDSSEPTYELNPGTGEEPIETNDRFISDLAGKPSAPLQGAIFRNPRTGEITTSDTPGEFEFDRFSILLPDGTLNPMAGEEAFITQNNTQWIKSWTQRSAPTSHPVRIDAPGHGAPDYGGAHNWLSLPVAYTKRGNVYSCKAVWLGSGPRGWNTATYPSA